MLDGKTHEFEVSYGGSLREANVGSTAIVVPVCLPLTIEERYVKMRKFNTLNYFDSVCLLIEVRVLSIVFVNMYVRLS